MKDLKTFPPKPSPEQVAENATIEHEGQLFTACWYPRMGGYGAHCLVIKEYGDDPNSCFDAYVWHDGEFPFSDQSPAHLHHCSADQFIEFGALVRGIAPRVTPSTEGGPVRE